MAVKPVYTGVPAIMSAVNSFIKDAPYVSLWNGQMLLAQFRDKNTVQTELEEILDNAVDVGNTDVFILKFHPKLTDGWITAKTPVVTSLPVQPLTRNASVAGSGQQWLPAAQYARESQAGIIGKIEEMFKPLNDRLTALETAEPVGDTDSIDKWLNRLNHPAVGSLVQMLLPKLMPGLNAANTMTNLQVAGVSDQVGEWNDGLTDEQIESVNDSLDILKTKGMDIPGDLAKLVAMATSNETLFKMLLGQLRS